MVDRASIAPGIYPGIPFNDYLAIDAVNSSLLKLFDRTPAHARHKMLNPKDDTEALRTGDATHVAILEPARFEAQYARQPDFNRRTNAGKAAAAQWAAEHPSQAALLAAEWDLAVAMRDAARAHPVAIELLGGVGQNEMTAIWTDEETGLRCKARMDRFTSYHGWSIVVDIKTCEDASKRGFAKAVEKYGYHIQAAYYLDGLNALAPHNRRFAFLCIEKAPPHCIATYELEESAIEEGRAQYRQALDQYAQCRKDNLWPGYPHGIDTIDLPRWAYELTTAQL